MKKVSKCRVSGGASWLAEMTGSTEVENILCKVEGKSPIVENKSCKVENKT
jgi:hypothetical protein